MFNLINNSCFAIKWLFSLYELTTPSQSDTHAKSVQNAEILCHTYGAGFVKHYIPDASASGYQSVIPTEC